MDLLEKIKQALSGDGSGSGYGDGSGDGSGYGYGDGSGSGSGYGSGSGSGYGYGSGDGSGDGSGSGYGDGSGSGYGSGSGSGYGSGYGSGDSNYEYKEIWYIDNRRCWVQKIDNQLTALYSIRIHDGYTIFKGYLVSDELSPTFVALRNGITAHGETITEAIDDLNNKIYSSLDFDSIVEDIKNKYSLTDRIKAKELLSIHRAITGSCRQGCMSWVASKDIDLEHDSFTLVEFINLTKNDYGSEYIRKLADSLNV